MKFFIVLCVIASATCTPVAQDESVLRLFLGNVVNCVDSDLGLCLKEQALKATERLRAVRTLKLTESITILNNAARDSRSLDLSSELEVRKKQVTERLWESTHDLLKNSDLELSFNAPGNDEEEESRSLDNAVEEGRGKKKEMKKKIKMLVPLLILAKAKAVALVILALLVIAASLFKLAVLAKIAFIAKVIAILKHLLHKKHHEEEHWVPHHEEHDHGWEGGWSRSRNEANNLAYSAYAN